MLKSQFHLQGRLNILRKSRQALAVFRPCCQQKPSKSTSGPPFWLCLAVAAYYFMQLCHTPTTMTLADRARVLIMVEATK